MKLKFMFLLAMLVISVDGFAQRYYSRSYPTRDYHYDYGYSHRRVVVQDPYHYDDVVVVRQPTRVVHVDRVQREKVYVHHRVEREYVHVNNSHIVDEVYDNGRREVVVNHNEYIPISEMWEMPIHFKRNSCVIDDHYDSSSCNGELNVFTIVKFLRQHPSVTITLYAYADMMTGTERDNYYLATRRGDMIYNSLVYKYDISPNRLTVRIMGSESQYYSTNRWNRCVIIKAN